MLPTASSGWELQASTKTEQGKKVLKMKYKIIYEIVKDEKGNVIDLINKAEFYTQSKIAEWLGVNQSTVSRVILPNYNKELESENILTCDGISYVIIEG